MITNTSRQGVFHNRLKGLLALFLGIVTGGILGYHYVHTESTPLVMPRQPGQLLGQQLSAKLDIPDPQEHLDALKANPIWQLTHDGKDFEVAVQQANAPAAPPQRWLLVGRVQRPDGPALIFYQPDTQVSKAFKESETLPDGRKLIKIEEADFVVSALKGRRTERLAYSGGLTMDVKAPDTAVSPPKS
jgi:hypothetical protein